MQNNNCEYIDNALHFIENNWKNIAAQYEQKIEPYEDNEIADLDTNLALLQKHLQSLQHIKTILKKLGPIRKTLLRVKANISTTKSSKSLQEKTLEDKVKILDDKKKTINNKMYAMHMDEHFLNHYIAAMDDYRLPVLPLPYGFLCHKTYQREVDFLKTSIEETKADVNARKELLQAIQRRNLQNLANIPPFSYFSTPINPTQQDEEEKRLIASINQGLDHYQMLQVKIYQFLNEIKPINADFFHSKCKALVKEKMDIMEQSRKLQVELQSLCVVCE